MKQTSRRLMLILMLAAFAFLSGFTYRDFGSGHGVGEAFLTLRNAFASLQATATTATESPAVRLSPVDTYWTAYNYLDSNYYGDRTNPNDDPNDENKVQFSRQLTYSAVRGMIKALGDRYTRFLDPKANKAMEEDNRGDFEGIGAKLDVKEGRVYIKEPIVNSPAIRAGLKAGDIILKVDDRLIQGLDIDDVVKRIRGPRGKKVKITVQREGASEPLDFEIVREVIPNAIVDWKMVDEANKIGYIALGQFNAKSDDQIDEALSGLESKGVKAVILDLRGNPGGLLEMAVAIGSRFIKSGDIVTIRDKNGIVEERKVDPSRHNHRIYPLAVLINGNSASASEIVAGAIQDHKAGTIIGTDSFGKGLVQQIIPLEDGSSVSITMARYLTPAGRDVAKHKIHPDIIVEEPKPQAPKPQTKPGKTQGAPGASGATVAGGAPSTTVAGTATTDDKKEKDDPQLKRAIAEMRKDLGISQAKN